MSPKGLLTTFLDIISDSCSCQTLHIRFKIRAASLQHRGARLTPYAPANIPNKFYRRAPQGTRVCSSRSTTNYQAPRPRRAARTPRQPFNNALEPHPPRREKWQNRSLVRSGFSASTSPPRAGPRVTASSFPSTRTTALRAARHHLRRQRPEHLRAARPARRAPKLRIATTSARRAAARPSPSPPDDAAAHPLLPATNNGSTATRTRPRQRHRLRPEPRLRAATSLVARRTRSATSAARRPREPPAVS